MSSAGRGQDAGSDHGIGLCVCDLGPSLSVVEPADRLWREESREVEEGVGRVQGREFSF